MCAEKLILEGFVHGKNLQNKVAATGDKQLRVAFQEYKRFRKKVAQVKGKHKKYVDQLVGLFNEYREVAVPVFEQRRNVGQENLRSTMLEELFVLLLQKLAIETCGERPENLYIGKGNGYVDLTFSPSSFSKMFTSPNPYFHSKDHDFLLGVKLIAHILPSESVLNQAQGEDIIVPAVAIECKTYLERNMLDSCAGTASRLKRAMPYCIYVVATEYLKLEVSQPELTDIDEIFVLCKASNAQRLEHRRLGQPLHPIDATLILELYNMVRSHINRVWWSPENALKDGKIINRPVIC